MQVRKGHIATPMQVCKGHTATPLLFDYYCE